jgi:hypothetical protein
MDIDQAKQKLLKLCIGVSSFDGLCSAGRDKQEYKSEHWDELSGLCFDLIEDIKFTENNTRLAVDSDRIHGEAFAAGISGVCENCIAYKELEAENAKLKKACSKALVTLSSLEAVYPGRFKKDALILCEQALKGDRQ